jgi:L,D-peptidoglycan transpeptidase YkuD (ErfK/YbiS/YcfS/YnhG family)
LALGGKDNRANAMIFTAWADGRFDLAGRWTRCALGRGGVRAAAEKREGDGATPLGVWPLRRVMYRPDRLEPPATRLPLQALTPDDGWCDDPADGCYNRPVKLPFAAGHEPMWRTDDLYDLVVVLGHNDDPPAPGLGSAIFLHVAGDGCGPTDGCVALARADLLEAVRLAEPGSVLVVVE